MRILVVDDDAANARVAAELLMLHGHAVCTARDGEQALAFARERRYDGAVVDYVLPGIDGFAVLEGLRSMRPGIRCVLVTGHFLPDGHARAGRVGATFRNKPLDFEEIARLLAR